MKETYQSWVPTWRFSEVATIDGIGWVMRNTGLRLDESYGYMHCYDLDLSLQYIAEGYRVYAAAVSLLHTGLWRSARAVSPEYLDQIGGDDGLYFDEVTARFRKKWDQVLPITRGFRDESYGYLRAEEYLHRCALYEDNISTVNEAFVELSGEIGRWQDEIARTRRHATFLENASVVTQADLGRSRLRVSEIEKELQELYRGGSGFRARIRGLPFFGSNAGPWLNSVLPSLSSSIKRVPAYLRQRLSGARSRAGRRIRQ